LHSEACEIQKLFLEELLRRGYVELARSVLEKTALVATGTPRAVALGNLSIIYKNAGELDRALATYEEARAAIEESGDMPNLARVLHQIGNTHYAREDYGSALTSYRRSLEISTELGDRIVATATRIQVGNTHYQCGEMEDALGEYLSAADASRGLGAHHLLAPVALQIGQIHLRERRYLQAEASLEEAEQAAIAAGDLRTRLKVLQSQGVLARERREYDAARERLVEAIELADALGDPAEAALALVILGDLERMRLQPAEAMQCYDEARGRLDGVRARTASTPAEVRRIEGEIEAQVRSLEESLGAEAFERVCRRARAGRHGGGSQG
jgi:tetratricopeptide (TPR) repeat protein